MNSSNPLFLYSATIRLTFDSEHPSCLAVSVMLAPPNRTINTISFFDVLLSLLLFSASTNLAYSSSLIVYFLTSITIFIKSYLLL